MYSVHFTLYTVQCTYINAHTCTHTYIFTHISIHTHPYTPTQTHTQTHLHKHTYRNTHTHITLHYIIDTAITACLCKYLPLEGRDEVGWAIFGHRVINYHNRYQRFARHICVELNILKMK